MKKNVLIVTAVLCVVSLALLAAPASGTFIPTIQRTGQIDQMNTLLLASNASTAPGLAVAAKVQLANAQRFIERDLAAVDTTGDSSEDVATYTQNVADLYTAIRTLGDTAAQLGLDDVAAQALTTRVALARILVAQMAADVRIVGQLNERVPGTIDDINGDFQPAD